MKYIRVRFNVSWGNGQYEVGELYDVEDTKELRAIIAAGLADKVPFPRRGSLKA